MNPAPSAVTMRTVSSRADLERFIHVPYGLYAGDPHWVAPLLMERREHLSRERNPFFAHGEAELFLALRDGEPVGRISAQIDRLHLARYQDATGFFGLIEAADDPAVFAALFAAAEDWLRTRGMRGIRGPLNFSINQEAGLLVDGFDRPPSIMMGHARPYYGARIEALGFRKAKDLIAYDYDARIQLPRAMRAMVERAKASGELAVRPLDKTQIDRELDILIDIFNDAWSDNWGFVPMSEQEIRHLGASLKMLVAGEYIAIAEVEGWPAAMAVSLPDINAWIADLGGRLLPFGFAKLLWRIKFRPPGAVRIPLMGVRKPHHGTAMGSALALAVIDAVRSYHVARGTVRAELSWILDDNLPMRRIIEAIGGKPYKTYRLYEREIAA